MELSGAPVDVDSLASLALVGFGHFTSMLVENCAVRGLELHLDRLIRDCRAVFDARLDPDRVRDVVRSAVRDATGPVVVRVTVYDPELQLSRPGARADPRLLVTTRAAPTTPQAPLRLRSVAYSRDLPQIKHVGLFGALHHRAAAQRAGFDDAVFVDGGGSISEIVTSNIAFINGGGELVWPRAEALVGTTMRLIDQSCGKRVLTDHIPLSQLGHYVGAVATNAATGVRAVTSIDDISWPVHEMVAELRDRYESIPPQQI